MLNDKIPKGIGADTIAEDSDQNNDPRIFEIDKLCNQIEKGFRKQFIENEGDPEDEIIVQNRLQNFLDAKEYQKGTDYDREAGGVNFSGKGFRPDFIFDELRLAIEVKYIKDKQSKQTCIEKMSGDMRPYLKKYHNIVFVVYDLGFVSDIEEFKRDFENNEGVKVILIKK